MNEAGFQTELEAGTGGGYAGVSGWGLGGVGGGRGRESLKEGVKGVELNTQRC